MNNKFQTIKTTENALKMLRLIAAHTGEKQYEVLERLLKIELSKLIKVKDLLEKG